jgi:5'-methylthioadenosine phosphorylase
MSRSGPPFARQASAFAHRIENLEGATVSGEIPKTPFAIIGGSGTWAISFPEDVNDPGVTVRQSELVFDTPYGTTAPFKLLRLAARDEHDVEKDVLHVPMHNWRRGAECPRIQASEQLFWVLQQAGVRQILVEASVGGLNHLLEPGDIVVPHDFIDQRTSRTTAFMSNVAALRMRSAMCDRLRAILIDEAEGIYRRVMRRGLSIVFEGPRLESPAEIALMRQQGGDIVGQSATPEVYLARSIGAHIAFLNIISNYAEGVNENWRTQDMADFYLRCGPDVGRTIMNAMRRVTDASDCDCPQYFPAEFPGMRAADAP